jgi:hypothetical protein
VRRAEGVVAVLGVFGEELGRRIGVSLLPSVDAAVDPLLDCQ